MESKPLSAISGNVATAQSANQLYTGQVSWPPSYPTNTYWYAPPADSYANAIEVKAGEFDATVTFYRKNGSARSTVATVTVPLGLLEQFLPKRGSKR